MNRQPIATASHYYTYHPHEHYNDPTLASLAYRPLQLPLQQSERHSSRHQQQQQLSLAAAAPSGFQQLNFRLHHQLPLRTRQQTRQARAMASFQPERSAEEELAELQKLSNEYEPEVTGPLVGPRQQSTAITTEYASADPVLQAKTAALPQKYSHYRTVRGDGRCGWRAIAFGYYETLIHYGDANKPLEEEARLRSLSNVINATGADPMLWEDFATEMYDLLRKVQEAMQTGDALEVLVDAFNDDMLQNYVMTHIKNLTAAWMKTRQQEYAPWLLGQTVEEYCNASVLPITSEIDNVSLSAVKDVLLSPAGITLEVLYLDRSEGSEVNMHRFSPVNHGGFDIGIIRLLYRPGHYDLLYRHQDLPQVSLPAAVPTYLQFASQPYQDPIYDLGVSDAVMTMIPGGSYANPHQAWISSSSYAGGDIFGLAPSVQTCSPAIPTPAAPAPQPQMMQPSHTYVPPTTTHLVPPPTQMPQELAIRTVPHATVPAHHGYQHQMGGPFRPSAWELEPDFVYATSQVPLQTAIFRNSHYNTAHFMNPEFQPEEWHPDDDYVTPSSKSRHRNSG